jgi:hypothetical protein
VEAHTPLVNWVETLTTGKLGESTHTTGKLGGSTHTTGKLGGNTQLVN